MKNSLREMKNEISLDNKAGHSEKRIRDTEVINMEERDLRVKQNERTL